MKAKNILIVLFSIVLISCTPSNNLASTATLSPMPAPTSTATITPSPTPLPENNFSVQIVGQGEHGAMIEIIYDGEWSDLDGVSIQVNIKQDGKLKDSLKDVEIMDGRHLVEMTDAKYFLGSIAIEIVLNKNDIKQIIQKEIEYKQIYPFIYPIFLQSDFVKAPFSFSEVHTIDKNSWFTNDYPIGSNWYAKDFCLDNNCEGTPIHMPFSFQITRIRAMKDICQPIVNYNIWIYSPYTGYTCALGHTQPGELLTSIVGNSEMNDYGGGFPPLGAPIFPYDPNKIMATMGPKDGCSGYPHLHFECQSPYLPSPYTEPGDDFFGYSNDKLRYGFCQDGITPCEQSRNIEMNDFLLSTWIISDK